jgi:hypothetical protein
MDGPSIELREGEAVETRKIVSGLNADFDEEEAWWASISMLHRRSSIMVRLRRFLCLSLR